MSLFSSKLLRHSLLLLGLFTSACGSPGDERLGVDVASIVNGHFDDGHPTVGALLLGKGGLCTATLVGARTVLTAAHCVEPGGQHVFILDNARWDVDEVMRFPDYDPKIVGKYDVALAILREAPPVGPSAITGVAPERDQEVELVGLGATGQTSGGSGFKRIAKNRIDKMSESTLTYRFASGDIGNLCFGDSGGPSFAQINGQEVQIGVHSFISGICGQAGSDMRVDAFRDWIEKNAQGDVRVGGFPDKTAPEVKIVAPTLDEELYAKVFVSVRATDEVGVARVELVVDGALAGQRKTAPYDFELDLKPGTHRLVAKAFDLVENHATATRTLVVHELKPFGASCEEASQCASGLCVEAVALQAKLCSKICNPTASPSTCPAGASCVKAEGDELPYCGAPAALLPASGCGVDARGASDSLGGGLLLGVFLGLYALRRRARWRSLMRRRR